MILLHTLPAAVLAVPAAINQDMKALIPGPDIAADYLCAILWAYNRELLALVERSTHGTCKFESPKLLGFPIPIPALEEQARVVAHLDQLQTKTTELRAIGAETAAELDALLPSLLDRAFRGEL